MMPGSLDRVRTMGSLRGAPMGPWTSPRRRFHSVVFRWRMASTALSRRPFLYWASASFFVITKSRTASRHGGGASRRFFSYKAATASRNFATRYELRSYSKRAAASGTASWTSFCMASQRAASDAFSPRSRLFSPRSAWTSARRSRARYFNSIAVNAKRSSPPSGLATQASHFRSSCCSSQCVGSRPSSSFTSS